MTGSPPLWALTFCLRHQRILIGKRWEFLIGFVSTENLRWSRVLPPDLALQSHLLWLRLGHRWHATGIADPRTKPAKRFVPSATNHRVSAPTLASRKARIDCLRR